MTREKVTLYYGNNGTKQFWKSKIGRLLILDNHKEEIWTAYRYDVIMTDKVQQAKANKANIKAHFILGGSLDYVISALKAQYEIEVVLDNTKQWQESSSKSKMILKAIGR